jgi:hypothetical protein
MNHDKAKEILSDVKAESYFKIHLGTNIGNLFELKEALTIMSNDSFKHHVNSQKNDFSAWVRNVIKDKDLAKSIEKITEREHMRDIISVRLDELEKSAAGETFNEDVRNTAMDFIMGIVVGFIIGLIVFNMLH